MLVRVNTTSDCRCSNSTPKKSYIESVPTLITMIEVKHLQPQIPFIWVKLRGCGLMHSSGTRVDREATLPVLGAAGTVKSVPTPIKGKATKVGAALETRMGLQFQGN